MQEKRKKFWIGFGISIAAVLVVAFVFGVITNLKTVTVEFRQRVTEGTNLEVNILDKVKDDGEFEYGKGLLFVDANKSIDKIEKENPYVKVEQVIRNFPNKLMVYISERVPAFYIEQSSNYYVLDKEFKVLEKFSVDSYQNQSGYEYLKDKFLTNIYKIDYKINSNAEAGDFAIDNGRMSLYKDVYYGIIGAQKTISGVKKVEIENSSAKIVMKQDNVFFEDGITILLEGEDELVEKTYVAIKYYYDEVDKTKTAQIIKLTKKPDGKYSAYIISN